jgi:hypothetical protein
LRLRLAAEIEFEIDPKFLSRCIMHYTILFYSAFVWTLKNQSFLLSLFGQNSYFSANHLLSGLTSSHFLLLYFLIFFFITQVPFYSFYHNIGIGKNFHRKLCWEKSSVIINFDWWICGAYKLDFFFSIDLFFIFIKSGIELWPHT